MSTVTAADVIQRNQPGGSHTDTTSFALDQRAVDERLNPAGDVIPPSNLR